MEVNMEILDMLQYFNKVFLLVNYLSFIVLLKLK